MTTGIKRIDRGRGHSYTIDGRKADGVTTLIDDGMPKPALIGWASKVVAEHVADNIADLPHWQSLGRDPLVKALCEVRFVKKNTAAARGTEVHELAEQLLLGGEVDMPPHLEGYVTGCVAFLDHWQPKPIRSEFVVASRKWSYAGTADLVASLPDGRVPIIDWKTGGVWPEVAMQLAAYANAEVFLDGDNEVPVSTLGITNGLAVALHDDGTYTVYDVNIGEHVHKAFLHVAYVARTRKRASSWVSEALMVPESGAVA